MMKLEGLAFVVRLVVGFVLDVPFRMYSRDIPTVQYSTCKQPVLRDHLLPLAMRFQFHVRHIPASWARTVHWGMANRDWQNRYVLYLNFKRHVGDTDPSSSVLVQFSYIRLTILRFADSEIIIGP